MDAVHQLACYLVARVLAIEYFKCVGDLVREETEVRSCPGTFLLTGLGSNFDPVGGSGGLWCPASG